MSVVEMGFLIDFPGGVGVERIWWGVRGGAEC
jgi:hypothetical protein